MEPTDNLFQNINIGCPEKDNHNGGEQQDKKDQIINTTSKRQQENNQGARRGKIIRKSKAASTITALHQLLILFCKLSPHRIIENEK